MGHPDIDTLQVLLASIRADAMADFDTGTMPVGEAADRQTKLFAEHAVDAAVARGATVEDIWRAVSTTMPQHAPPDTPLPADALADIRDLSRLGLQRSIAIHAADALACLVIANAHQAIADEARTRAADAGLDPNRTPLSRLLSAGDARQVFLANLHPPEGDPT